MLDKAQMEAMVKAMAIETFSGDVIAGVDCQRGEDHVGDPVIWVTVLTKDGKIFRGGEKTLRFNVDLSKAIRQGDETAYPILSFLPASEWKGSYPFPKAPYPAVA